MSTSPLVGHGPDPVGAIPSRSKRDHKARNGLDDPRGRVGLPHYEHQEEGKEIGLGSDLRNLGGVLSREIVSPWISLVSVIP